MAVVYKHTRLDTDEIFYIGIGKTEKRAYQKIGRNKYWKNIVKNINYNIEIIYSDLSWQQACEKEIELIKFYGRKDLNKGTLVNFTDGGDGTLGRNWSEQERNKIKGNNHYLRKYPLTEEYKKHIEYLAKYNKGNTYAKGRINSPEHKQKVIEAIRKEILQFSKKGEFIQEWYSISEAANKLSINRKAINECLSNRTKSSAGFIWKYKNK